jgi:hypothetical protein
LVKIAVFYHVYQAGNWQEIFNEQFGAIEQSGLLDEAEFVHLGINGTMQFNYPKVNSLINPNQHMEETETLKSLLNFSKENPGYKVLYIHTKGVNKNLQLMDDWRRMMNYFCIERWEEVVPLLDKYDAVGCNYFEDTWLGHYPHFSGNFWWSNTDYIVNLDHSFLETSRRWDREFWIGTGSGTMHEIFNSEVDHFQQKYPRSKYINKPIKQDMV